MKSCRNPTCPHQVEDDGICSGMCGTEPVVVSQQTSQSVLVGRLTAPLLYLSSEAAGWEDLVVQAFHEPLELEGWMRPATSDISLILFTGGAMHLEQRHPNGPWKALYLHQGDLILRSGTPYEVRWKSLSSLPTQTLHLRLSQELLARTAQEVVGYDPAHLSVEEHAGFQDPLLRHVGLALWRELEQPAPAGNLYAQTTAQMIAMHLLRYYTSGGSVYEDPSGGLTQQQMRRVLDFVQDHLDQDLSLETLAQQAGFSPYHFARLFRHTTGVSPHQFVLRQRIERAQSLLDARDLPLVHVAGVCGFANQSHLTQVFKRHLGLTPRAYRQGCSH